MYTLLVSSLAACVGMAAASTSSAACTRRSPSANSATSHSALRAIRPTLMLVIASSSF